MAINRFISITCGSHSCSMALSQQFLLRGITASLPPATRMINLRTNRSYHCSPILKMEKAADPKTSLSFIANYEKCTSLRQQAEEIVFYVSAKEEKTRQHCTEQIDSNRKEMEKTRKECLDEVAKMRKEFLDQVEECRKDVRDINKNVLKALLRLFTLGISIFGVTFGVIFGVISNWSSVKESFVK